MSRRTDILLIGVVLLSGCFHATVETGVAPSDVVVEKRWASGWIAGLVPPSTVATAARCPEGVSRVETKFSFLNQLVGALTLSIYTPMAIKVTCAAPAAPATAAAQDSVAGPPAALAAPDSGATGVPPAELSGT